MSEAAIVAQRHDALSARAGAFDTPTAALNGLSSNNVGR
jgi:hypothetical protein